MKDPSKNKKPAKKKSVLKDTQDKIKKRKALLESI